MSLRRAGGLIAVVAIVLVAVTFVIRDDEEADTSVTTTPTSTAAVERGDLVSSEDVDGQLTFEATRPIVNQASGVMTWRPDVGTVIDRGGVIYKVDDQPIILMLGDTPIYREMSTDSTTGPDIVQLQGNLIALGYGDGLTLDGEFDAATKSAVEAFEEAVGLEADGIVQRGEITFAPAAIRVAAASVDVGGGVQAGSSVLEATGTTTVVTATLSAEQANQLPVGTEVQVRLPDDSTAAATVTSLAEAEATSDNAEPGAVVVAGPGETNFTATLQFVDPAVAAAFDDASVDVILAADEARDVLSVPVTALVALAEGGYAVEVVDDSAAGSHLVAVEVGLFADERVEITADGVEVGDDVVVPA